MRKAFALVVAAMMPMLAPPAWAQADAEFFRGKSVTYIVTAAPGGGYDSYGRLIAEYMQKHLPGSTFVIKNMPGAGHIIGTNSLYASKPDGLTVGTFSTGLVYNQIIRQPAVKFDLTKMSWIGKAASDPRVILVAAQSPLKTFDDLMSQKQPVNFSASGVGSASYVEMVMLTRTLKMPVRVLTGYAGNDDQLAMRRGEITGTLGSRSSAQTFVDNGYGRILAQIGGREQDVPQLASLVTDQKALDLIALVQSQGDIARLTAGPPGIPAYRMATLTGAFRKAMEDPDLQARALRLDRPVEPAYGDEVLKIVTRALDQSEETRALLTEALKPSER